MWLAVTATGTIMFSSDVNRMYLRLRCGAGAMFHLQLKMGEETLKACFTYASAYGFLHVHVATPHVCMSLEACPQHLSAWTSLPSDAAGVSQKLHQRPCSMSHTSLYLLQLARGEVISPSLKSFGWLLSSFPFLHCDRAGCYSRNATRVLAARCHCSWAVLGAVSQPHLPLLGSELPSQGWANRLGVGYCGCSETTRSPAHSFLIF